MSKAEEWVRELEKLRGLRASTNKRVEEQENNCPHFLGTIDPSSSFFRVAEVDCYNGDLKFPTSSPARVTKDRVHLFVKWLVDIYGPFEEDER